MTQTWKAGPRWTPRTAQDAAPARKTRRIAMDPLTDKGSKIMRAMKDEYGEERGERVFYASKNKGTIRGVDSRRARAVRDKRAKRVAARRPTK